MSRGDIVDTGTDVPNSVVEDLVSGFQTNGYNLKQTLKDVLLHDDFVSF